AGGCASMPQSLSKSDRRVQPMAKVMKATIRHSSILITLIMSVWFFPRERQLTLTGDGRPSRSRFVLRGGRRRRVAAQRPRRDVGIPSVRHPVRSVARGTAIAEDAVAERETLGDQARTWCVALDQDQSGVMCRAVRKDQEFL